MRIDEVKREEQTKKMNGSIVQSSLCGSRVRWTCSDTI